MMNLKMDFVKFVDENREIVDREDNAMAYSKEVARKRKQKAKDIYAAKLIGETLLVFPLFWGALTLASMIATLFN